MELLFGRNYLNIVQGQVIRCQSFGMTMCMHWKHFAEQNLSPDIKILLTADCAGKIGKADFYHTRCKPDFLSGGPHYVRVTEETLQIIMKDV